MNNMKRNILFLSIIGVIVIFGYQFYLNVDKITLEKYNYKTTKFEEHEIIHFNDEHKHSEDDSSLALKLSKQVRIMCWVMTSPANHKSKAVHVMATWGKRCNKLLFASESLKDSEGLPMLLINTTKGRDHLTAKTMQAFDVIYKDYFDEYDWFLKADDDTYVVIENLRYFLSSKNTNDPLYFGHHFHMYLKQGYFSGGAGYVLSKEALRRFGERSKGNCNQDNGAEDLEIGKCMSNLGVVAGDSRDSLGRSRFHCFPPTSHIRGIYPDWYYLYDTYGGKKGISTISDYAISFHYVDPDSMYLFDFFLFHLRPYGILNYPQDLNVRTASGTTINPLLSQQSSLMSALSSTPGVETSQEISSSPPSQSESFSTQVVPTSKSKKRKKRPLKREKTPNPKTTIPG